MSDPTGPDGPTEPGDATAGDPPADGPTFTPPGGAFGPTGPGGPGEPLVPPPGTWAPPVLEAEPTAPLAGPRPAPSVPSLVGTVAGVLLVAGLLLLLSELGADHRRLGGIVVSLLFEALGVLLLLRSKGRRAATAGGTLAGVAVVPLLGYVFVDAGEPSNTFDSVDGFTGTATTILVIAAAIWFCAWFFGPGRRYAFFLAAACLSLWLATQVQLVERPLEQLFAPFSTSSQFVPVGPSIDEPTFDDGFGTPTYDPETETYEYDDEFEQELEEQFESSYEGYEEPDDPSTALGMTSLLFGAAYLALAARRDRAGDGRAATALFGVSAPILLWSLSYLSGDLETAGTSILALAIGGVAIWLGTRAERRFTSWAGAVLSIVAVLALVDDALGESARASAIVLVAVGLGLAFAAAAIERRGEAGSVPPTSAPSDPPAWTPPPDHVPEA